jgi:hypothetical protein
MSYFRQILRLFPASIAAINVSESSTSPPIAHSALPADLEELFCSAKAMIFVIAFRAKPTHSGGGQQAIVFYRTVADVANWACPLEMRGALGSDEDNVRFRDCSDTASDAQSHRSHCLMW